MEIFWLIVINIIFFAILNVWLLWGWAAIISIAIVWGLVLIVVSSDTNIFD